MSMLKGIIQVVDHEDCVFFCNLKFEVVGLWLLLNLDAEKVSCHFKSTSM